MHIQLVMLWEFKNNKNATWTTRKICSVYLQGVITDHQVWNWFSKFYSGDKSLRDEPRQECSTDLDQDASRELVECNMHKNTQELALDLNTSK